MPNNVTSARDHGIVGFHLGLRDEVQLFVISTGCTTEEDFSVTVQKVPAGGVSRLSLRRIRRDECKGEAHVITLTYDKASLGIEDMEELLVPDAFVAFSD
jgi:hypothetical protein